MGVFQRNPKSKRDPSALDPYTAGALGEGERVWILAKLPDSIRVVGDDITDKYLLLSNSHDGESAVQIKFTPIRVVCQNTLSMALAQGPTLRVAHHRNVVLRLKQAVSLLGIIKVQYSQIGTSFKAMVGVPINGKRLTEYLQRVFPEPQPGAGAPGRYERAVMQIKQHREWATQLFEQGAGNRLKGVPGTLWAAYNGVTEMVDHHAAKSALAQRLQDIWFGGGYSINQGRILSTKPCLSRSNS
ncbi:MAG: DUF932 domain-containing protein [Kiritimatiellaeota bacterium]|nr:DUF932 domain-containing protein [Kiritimatiellota bacterium]